MDDIYIYHAYTLSLLLTMFQKKHRRGRLHFQEREDDMDIATPDTTKIISHIFIYQVNSNNYKLIYYSANKDKDTTRIYIICRYLKDLYKPCVRMRSATHLGDDSEAAELLLCVLACIDACVYMPTHIRESAYDHMHACMMARTSQGARRCACFKDHVQLLPCCLDAQQIPIKQYSKEPVITCRWDKGAAPNTSTRGPRPFVTTAQVYYTRTRPHGTTTRRRTSISTSINS